MTDVVFTIGSRNYLAQSVTLMRSLAENDPSVHRVLVVSDGPPDGLADDPRLAGVEILCGSAVCPDLDAMAAYYAAIELNTAIKPYAFERLLARPGVASVVYLDPDIEVYRPLADVREALGRAELVLTPHLTRPLPGPHSPNDHVVLRSGVYNLGFAGLRPGPAAAAFCRWWAERCRYDCRVAFEEGLFTDQRWVDLAPGFFDTFERLRSPAFNLAYWNLPNARFDRTAQGWTADGEPLAFFHFSGFDPQRPDLLSKHQDRIVVAPGSPLAQLLAGYAARMNEHGAERWKAEPYGFDRFASGRRFTGLMRRLLLRDALAGRTVDRSASVEATLDAADLDLRAPGLPPLSRLAAQAWREVPGAADFHPLDTVEGRLNWIALCIARGEAWGLDAAARGAIQAQIEGWRGGVEVEVISGPATVVPLPSWRGRARDVGAWFAGSAPGEAGPRAVIAASRGDAALRAQFPRLDEPALLGRCVGREAAEGKFAPALLPTEAWVGLMAVSAEKLTAWLGVAATGAPTALSEEGARLRLAFGASVRGDWPAAVRAELAAPWAKAEALAVPRTLWSERPDLQRVFDLRGPVGRLRLMSWFARVGLHEYGLEREALPDALKRHPAFWLRARRAAAQPPRSGLRRLVVACAPARIRALADLPADTLQMDPHDGAWRDLEGRAVAPPSRIERLIHAGGPEAWAPGFMRLTRLGLIPASVAGWPPADIAPAADDWALGLVDVLIGARENEIGGRPMVSLERFLAETPQKG